MAVELRVRGTILGRLVTGGTAVLLEVKKGARLYTVNLTATVADGYPVILERVLHPAGPQGLEGAEGDSAT